VRGNAFNGFGNGNLLDMVIESMIDGKINSITDQIDLNFDRKIDES
jgi:hypothetical protein